MNENIDLVKILKDCPKETKLYCSLYGEVLFRGIGDDSNSYLIELYAKDLECPVTLTREGKYFNVLDGECVLFPSKDQRDWSKFTAPWYKKERFDPKTLKPFDKVLVKTGCSKWTVSLFSFVDGEYVAVTNNTRFPKCIPFNDDTKYLLGTTENAMEYYRYWEDEDDNK